MVSLRNFFRDFDFSSFEKVSFVLLFFLFYVSLCLVNSYFFSIIPKMPARHSKNNTDKSHFTYHEKQKAGLGTLKQRLGSESQLPFGYCALTLQPAVDPVVTPSGRIYSREAIIEYLLTKSKELKVARDKYEEQQVHFFLVQ
jgi:hypothetical protein